MAATVSITADNHTDQREVNKMALKMLHVPNHKIDYPDDVAEIRKELERQGYTASNSAIAWAYSEWSEARWCASWLMLNVGVVSIQEAAKGVREYLVE